MSSTSVPWLLQQLTLEEKISLVSGADGWQTKESKRLGIGSLKTTDGPAGVRGRFSVEGSQAAFLPAPIAQAATWSRADMRAIGQILSREAETKAAQILLAPTICCVRNPLGGRNFESFSEDPFLSGYLAIEYIGGVQESGRVLATAKHFVANEQEHQRFTINAVISQKALREIYLRPFEMIVKGPDPPGCIMTAYNSVNGFHADMNRNILDQILRDEWKFQGLVMSDWGGTNSTIDSLIAGCDLEMPGPPLQRGETLLQAVTNDSSDEIINALDKSCERLLTLAKKMNLLGLSEEEAESSKNREERSATTAEDIATLRKIATSGMVLLKNSRKILPLVPETLAGKKVAFIGPNALIGAAGGGGSASLSAQCQALPMKAFKERAAECGVDVQVEFSQGSYGHRWLPLASEDTWSVSDGEGGSILKIDFFDEPEYSGNVVETQYRKSSHIDLFDTAPVALQTTKPYSFRMHATVIPQTAGTHAFEICSIGNSRLFVDDHLLIDNYDWTQGGDTFYSFGSAEAQASMEMIAGQSYNVIVESSTKPPKTQDDGTNDAAATDVYGIQPSLRLGFLEQPPDNIIEQAVALARKSDYTVVVLGLNEEWESEGFDRQTMELPGTQNQLLRTLLNKLTDSSRLIIVNQSGSPVEMPWADEVDTILQAWYGGQVAGEALADVLLGLIDPSGRLPSTWPRRYTDLPFATHPETWPGVNGQVRYEEGAMVGYRWYLQSEVQPQWWFGYGLNYGDFAKDNMEVIYHEDGLTTTVNVKNTGSTPGQEVVQVYSWQSGSSTKELRGFDKTPILLPGDMVTMRVDVKLRDMAHWVEDQWVIERGRYTFGICEHVGAPAILTQEVTIDTNWKWEL